MHQPLSSPNGPPEFGKAEFVQGEPGPPEFGKAEFVQAERILPSSNRSCSIMAMEHR